MATLYILDWHKRYPSSTGQHAYLPGQEASKPPPWNRTTTKKGPLEIVENGQTGVDKGGTTAKPWPEIVDWPGGTPPPELEPCTDLDCVHYCCPNVYVSAALR